MLEQEKESLFILGKAQVKEALLETERVSSAKDNLDKDYLSLATELDEVRQQLENKIPSRTTRGTVGLQKQRKEKNLMEQHLKLRIEELKEKTEVAHEKLDALERYAIDLEKKYLNLGGNLQLLTRPYPFFVLERH